MRIDASLGDDANRFDQTTGGARGAALGLKANEGPGS